jgi:hypothetical protein
MSLWHKQRLESMIASSNVHLEMKRKSVKLQLMTSHFEMRSDESRSKTVSKFAKHF